MSLFFLHFFYDLFFIIFKLYTDVFDLYTGALETRGCHVPWNWELRVGCEVVSCLWCLELNSDPVEEQRVLLVTESFSLAVSTLLLREDLSPTLFFFLRKYHSLFGCI